MIRCLVLAAFLTACGSGTTANGTPEATITCDAAPRWLVSSLREGITTDGAEIADAYVAPASELSGLPIFEGSRWDEAWWILGRISGTRGDDELGIWLTNSLDRANPGLLLAANAGAREHTAWGADIDALIAGHGTEARSCTGLE